MFTLALSTAKSWKQSKCPLIFFLMNKEDVVYIYNGILLSHKKNELMPFSGTWMDLEIIILSEVSETEKNKYHIMLLICEI